MAQKVLFICSGNYYRSRFAEILFNHLAEKEGLDMESFSRGYFPSDKNPGDISVHTIKGLKERNIPFDEKYQRMPIRLSEADLEAADIRIAVKEKEHRPLTQRDFPAWEEKIEFWHIDDIDAAMPADALPLLEEKVRALFEGLKNQ